MEEEKKTRNNKNDKKQNYFSSFIKNNKNNNNTKTVIANNARAFNPTVIDSTGKNVTYLRPNANYTMDGTESYVNSGGIWPGRL